MIKVPEPTLQRDFLALYQKGQIDGDMVFVVAGERVQAHALILTARSEVFATELAAGMRESISKEIHIPDDDDVDIGTFKAFLKFLYTDDLNCVEDELRCIAKEEEAGASASCSSCGV